MSKKILIVEDNPQIVKILEIRLQGKGYATMTAMDGAAGLNLAKTESPDLIVLDIELPELNGFTICSILKANEEYRHIPIIMLTARTGKNDRVFDDDYKPDAFMTKPFDAKELMAKISELLGE